MTSAAPAAAADQGAQHAELPEEEIAWEVVESATPAAEGSSAAPQGDSLSCRCTFCQPCVEVTHTHPV